jgi:hypothetical protein
MKKGDLRDKIIKDLDQEISPEMIERVEYRYHRRYEMPPPFNHWDSRNPWQQYYFWVVPTKQYGATISTGYISWLLAAHSEKSGVCKAREGVIFKPALLCRDYPKGRRKVQVEARDLLCYWAVRELGISCTDLAKQLEMTQPGVGTAMHTGHIF